MKTCLRVRGPSKAETTSAGQQVVADYRESNELNGRSVYRDPDRDRTRPLILAVDVS